MTLTRGVRAALLIPLLFLVVGTTACTQFGTNATSAPKPAQVFDGKCASIVTGAQVTADLGAKAIPLAAPALDPARYATGSLGGVDCYWHGPKSADLQFLDLAVLPADAITHPVTKPLTCSVDEDGYSLCYFNVFDSGYWFSGRTAHGATSSSIKAGTARLEAQLAKAAAAAGDPPTVKKIPGQWAKPSSCSALGANTKVVAASGSPTLRPTTLSSDPDWPDGDSWALAASAYLGCAWGANDTVAPGKLAGFTVQLVPGGAWAKPFAVTSKFTSVTIPGADSAFARSNSGGVIYLDAFKGSNWVAVEPFGGTMTLAQATPIAAAVLKALG